VCRDPKDDQFLALALACGADVLVSSDADLRALHPWLGIPVLSPQEFLLSNE
jgi:predicted nucleic acid-binding protein